ncbi:MAG TPA: DUF5684 domain-containing protein [Rectinemataceae bacterium]|nr:DUF5684 domain-containing protein [Rectinemataceae bacterium]
MDYSSQTADAMRAFTVLYPIMGVVTIVGIVAMWKLFLKAGQPGWAAIIPIYNLLVFLRVVNRPWWWILLMLIPIVNIVLGIIVIFDLGKSFGKGGAWSFFLLLILSLIGCLILAFGKSEYRKIERPRAAAAA